MINLEQLSKMSLENATKLAAIESGENWDEYPDSKKEFIKGVVKTLIEKRNSFNRVDFTDAELSTLTDYRDSLVKLLTEYDQHPTNSFEQFSIEMECLKSYNKVQSNRKLADVCRKEFGGADDSFKVDCISRWLRNKYVYVIPEK